MLTDGRSAAAGVQRPVRRSGDPGDAAAPGHPAPAAAGRRGRWAGWRRPPRTPASRARCCRCGRRPPRPWSWRLRATRRHPGPVTPSAGSRPLARSGALVFCAGVSGTADAAGQLGWSRARGRGRTGRPRRRRSRPHMPVSVTSRCRACRSGATSGGAPRAPWGAARDPALLAARDGRPVDRPGALRGDAAGGAGGAARAGRPGRRARPRRWPPSRRVRGSTSSASRSWSGPPITMSSRS